MLIEEKKKMNAEVFTTEFSTLDFVATEAKKMVAKVKKMSGILGISQEPGT